jgi:hypothetical protein
MRQRQYLIRGKFGDGYKPCRSLVFFIIIFTDLASQSDTVSACHPHHQRYVRDIISTRVMFVL